MTTSTPDLRTRVRPRLLLGVGVYLAYLVVFYAIWVVDGIDYARIGESADLLLRWYVLPLAGGFVVVAALVTALGWWRSSMVERRPLPRTGLVVPVVMALVAVLNIVLGDVSRVTPTMWLYLLVGSLLVGFNEELLTRGQLIVALRSRFGEWGVYLVSTLLFSLLHLPNLFFGIGGIAVLQVVIQVGLGSVYYLAWRASGSLVPAMVLHGLWDFSTFSSSLPWAGLAAPVIGVAGVVVAVVLVRRQVPAAGAAGARTATSAG
jgi:uncharacterized protein